MTPIDTLEISEQSIEKWKSQLTLNQIFPHSGNPEQSANSAADQKCPDSTSSTKISNPDPYLPYDTMPTKLMEALCGKEREHWKKAWEFEMDRASLKQTWEDVEEEEFTVGDTADLVNSFK